MKLGNYITITGDNEKILEDICSGVYNYYSGKKGEEIKIRNYYTKKDEQISSKHCIYINETNLENEIELGSKTYFHSKLNRLFKEKIPIEPTLITINSLIQDLELEESTQSLTSEISKFSDYKIKIIFDKLTSTDFIKKAKITLENKEIIESLDYFEKFKIYLGILDENILNKEKIYIFLFPEKNIPINKLKNLKEFLFELAINNQVIVATFSKYLMDFQNFNTINIYMDNKLKNILLEEELLNEFENNYPISLDKSEIKQKLSFVLEKYLWEIFFCNKISNKIYSKDSIYISSYEVIFLLLFFLKLSNIPYSKEIEYNSKSPFSNYIKEKL